MSPVQVNDSIQLDLATNKVQDIIKFEVRGDQQVYVINICILDKQILQVGNLCMVTGGANAGRVGSMVSRCDGGNGEA